MKIAISSHPHAGGSGIVASELAMALADRGHEVHVIACQRPLRLRDTPGVTFHSFEINNYPLFRFPPHDLCLINKLAEICDDHDIDIIHAHYAIPHAVAAHMAGEMSTNRKCRVVTTLHGTDVTLVGSHPDFFKLTKYIMQQSDGLTTVSTWLREKTVKYFGLDRHIEVIPNFIDTTRFHNKDRAEYPERDPFKLLHISNFRPVKRVTDIIRTFHLVRKELPATLTLIGNGPEIGSVRELVAELNLTGSVTFIPVTQTLAPLYRKSHLFLLLSDYESFGVSALEALACGLPVIASNSGALPEIIKPGSTGYLCGVGDFREAASNAIKILGSRSRWEEMSAEAARASAERFDTGIIVPHYEAFYKHILEG